jgi:hypothetical protein
MKAVREIQVGKSSIRKNLICAAIAASAIAGVVGQASAAQWTGTWDPVYLGLVSPAGFPFYDPANGDTTYLYFSGSGLFDTGSCSGDGILTPALCPGMSITNVKMTLGSATSTTATAASTADPTQTINFTGVPVSITSMIVSGGQLVAVNAGYITPWVQGTIDGTALQAFGDAQPYFSVSFNSISTGTFSASSTTSLSSTSTVGGYYSYATLGFKLSDQFDGACTSSPTSVRAGQCGAEDAVVTFTPAIPEPSTYALMGLGLAAVAVMRRRATRKVTQA